MDFDEEDLGMMIENPRPKTSGRDRGEGFGNRPSTGASIASRPMSRHGSAMGGQRPFSRQSTAMGNGRMASARPTSGRIGSAVGHRPGPVPGTASRLTATAMQGRPMTGNRGSALGIQTPVPQVADRPITQQGLTGIRTAAGGTSIGGSQRHVQDKSYFVGILRAKMSELTTEIKNIQGEVLAATDEQSTFLAYEKRVKEAAAELTEQQAKLADYNLLVDKLNTDTEVSSVEREYAELSAQNETDSREVDSLFAEKQARLQQIQMLEEEVDQVGNMADNLISAMKPSLRERYMQLKNQNLQYQEDLERMNQELDTLNSRKAILDDEVAVSAVKKEALSLYDTLREVEKKRDDLINEEKNRGTPAQERERLLNQVKEDNAEIATMEQQIAEIQDHINRLQEEQSQLDQDLEENQSEKNQKYRDLRKREETMDSFLASFESNRIQELERCSELQIQIEQITEKMSRHLSSVSGQSLPNRVDFAAMKEDLAFREDEIEKSKHTLEGLTVQHNQLNINLEKIEALEGKIKSEMVSLKEKMSKMEEELLTYSDLERLRTEAAERRELLEQEHLSLSTRKMVAVQNADQVKSSFQSLTKQMAESETAVQLNNLEKKWSHLEQNNFAIEEFVANKKAEMNFELVKNKVLKMQWAYNRMLIDNVKNLTTAPSTAY